MAQSRPADHDIHKQVFLTNNSLIVHPPRQQQGTPSLPTNYQDEPQQPIVMRLAEVIDNDPTFAPKSPLWPWTRASSRSRSSSSGSEVTDSDISSSSSGGLSAKSVLGNKPSRPKSPLSLATLGADLRASLRSPSYKSKSPLSGTPKDSV